MEKRLGDYLLLSTLEMEKRLDCVYLIHRLKCSFSVYCFSLFPLLLSALCMFYQCALYLAAGLKYNITLGFVELDIGNNFVFIRVR